MQNHQLIWRLSGVKHTYERASFGAHYCISVFIVTVIKGHCRKWRHDIAIFFHLVIYGATNFPAALTLNFYSADVTNNQLEIGAASHAWVAKYLNRLVNPATAITDAANKPQNFLLLFSLETIIFSR